MSRNTLGYRIATYPSSPRDDVSGDEASTKTTAPPSVPLLLGGHSCSGRRVAPRLSHRQNHSRSAVGWFDYLREYPQGGPPTWRTDGPSIRTTFAWPPLRPRDDARSTASTMISGGVRTAVVHPDRTAEGPSRTMGVITTHWLNVRGPTVLFNPRTLADPRWRDGLALRRRRGEYDPLKSRRYRHGPHR